MKIANRNVLFTGDTGWDFDLAAMNEELLKRNGVHTRADAESGNVNLLVCHIGSVLRKEFNIGH